MMAGTRRPSEFRAVKLRGALCLVMLTSGLMFVDVLRGQQEDDAEFRQPRQGTAPSGSRPRGAGAAGQGAGQRRPTRTVTEEEGGEERPRDPAVLEVQKLTPELESVLDNWEAKTSQINKLKGSFVKTTYDTVFSVQTMAKGEFMYEAPDKGYYTFLGYSDKNARVKRDKDGNPYQLQADKDEKWYCTGAEIYQINVSDRTFDKLAIPEENRGKNIIDGPLPFLFGMKKEQAVRRYRLELLKSNPNQIWIGVKPKLQHDMTNYSEATVILDPETYLPVAVKLIDPPGTKETVHLFSNVTTSIIKWPLVNPFRPSLIGYKQVVRNEAPVEGEEQVGPPQRARPRTAQRESEM